MVTTDGPGDSRTLTIELARAVVAEVAPEELDGFDANAERCMAAAHQRGRDEMLGFGLEALLPFATSGAVWAASYSVQKLVDESTKAVALKGTAAFFDWLTGLWRKRTHAKRVPVTKTALTGEQLSRVREGARRAALRCGVAPARAALLADSLVGQLATST